MTREMTELLLTERDAARLLSVSVRTLQGWRYKGEGPPFIRAGMTTIRYRASDIAAWVTTVHPTEGGK